jgi:hypothetical protein
MNNISEDFKEKEVLVYTVYTREPHAGEIIMGSDFSDKKQTKTPEERVNYAKLLIENHGLKYPVLIDTFHPECIQETLGGGAPNSLIVIDRGGKTALWQVWTDPSTLRKKLEEMTGGTTQ